MRSPAGRGWQARPTACQVQRRQPEEPGLHQGQLASRFEKLPRGKGGKLSRRRVAIVEGNFDYAIQKELGFLNVVSAMGKELSAFHLSMLKSAGCGEIVICFDSDKRGREALTKMLVFEEGKPPPLLADCGMKVLIAELPDGTDPAEWAREEIAAGRPGTLDTAPTISSFSWVMNHLEDEIDDTFELAEQIMPYIVAEHSDLRQYEMLSDLSARYDIPVSVLQKRLDQRMDQAAVVQRQKAKDIARSALNLVIHGGVAVDIEKTLRSALVDVVDVTGSEHADEFDLEEGVEALDEQESEELDPNRHPGIKLGELHALEPYFKGDLEGAMYAFPGRAQTMKTAILSQFSIEAVLNNEDVVVVCHTIDDPRVKWNRRLILQVAIQWCRERGSPLAHMIDLNMIANPNSTQLPADLHRQLMEARAYGYEVVRDLMASKRLIVKDAISGRPDMDYFEQLVGRVCERSGSDQRVIAVLDNFHKVRSAPGTDQYTAVSEASSHFAERVLKQHRIPGLASFEFKKLSASALPTLDAISGSVKIEYDADCIMMMYNKLRSAIELGRPDGTALWHGEMNHRHPIIKTFVLKNKVTGIERNLHWRSFGAQSRHISLTDEELNTLVQRNLTLLGEEEEPTLQRSRRDY